MGATCSTGNRPSATIILMEDSSRGRSPRARSRSRSPTARRHKTTNPLRLMTRQRQSSWPEPPSHRETLEDDERRSASMTPKRNESSEDASEIDEDMIERSSRRRPESDVSRVRPSAAVKDYAAVSSQNSRFRKYMEDECVVVPKFVAFEGDRSQSCFFGVFDGHGGAFCSKYLARNFHSRLSATLASRMGGRVVEHEHDHDHDHGSPSSRSTRNTAATYSGSTDTCECDDPLTPEDIEKCYIETYATLDNELAQYEEASACGSTAVTCLVRMYGGRTTFHIANVGDSRAILFTNNKTTRLSVDHKATNEDEKKRILARNGIIFNKRVGGCISVTRALGQTNEKEFITADPHTVWGEIETNNSFLILASDGVTDVFTDEELTTFTAKRLKRGKKPVTICEKVLHQAKVRGACDNMTLVVIFFNDAIYAPHTYSMAP